MREPERWQVAGYPGYEVRVRPYRVYGPGGQQLAFIPNTRGKPRVWMRDANGVGRRVNIITAAALAFRGVPPTGHQAFHTGGEIVRGTVFWLPASEAQRKRRQKVTDWQRFAICEMWQDGATQCAIASEYGISQSTVSKYIQQIIYRSYS